MIGVPKINSSVSCLDCLHFDVLLECSGTRTKFLSIVGNLIPMRWSCMAYKGSNTTSFMFLHVYTLGELKVYSNSYHYSIVVLYYWHSMNNLLWISLICSNLHYLLYMPSLNNLRIKVACSKTIPLEVDPTFWGDLHTSNLVKLVMGFWSWNGIHSALKTFPP